MPTRNGRPILIPLRRPLFGGQPSQVGVHVPTRYFLKGAIEVVSDLLRTNSRLQPTHYLQPPLGRLTEPHSAVGLLFENQG